jgi:hypothetical protein
LQLTFGAVYLWCLVYGLGSALPEPVESLSELHMCYVCDDAIDATNQYISLAHAGYTASPDIPTGVAPVSPGTGHGTPFIVSTRLWQSVEVAKIRRNVG